jgi:hypothetical protein
MDGGSRDPSAGRDKALAGREASMDDKPAAPARWRAHVPAGIIPRHRSRKPSPHTFTGSAELNAMVERVAPSIIGLLADGVPRTKPAIVEALAGRHDRQDVVHALVRLAVTGRVVETSGRYTPGDDGPPEAA